MKIRELLNESKIEIGAELFSKDEALKRLIKIQFDCGEICNPTALKREIEAGEILGSSAVSSRIAIPCVSHNGAKHTSISALTVREGVDYNAPDKRKVRLIFMVVGKGNSDEYIQVKSRLMHLLMDSEFTARLCSAKSSKEFMEILSDREKERYSPLPYNPKYDCSKFLEKQKKRKTGNISNYLLRLKNQLKGIKKQS